MELVLWAVTITLALQLLFVLWNLRQMPKLGLRRGDLLTKETSQESKQDNSGDRPLLSVLIPARNEEEQIGQCVSSVLADCSMLLEVLVLDDQSEDGTYEAASVSCSGDNRLRVIKGTEKPNGWMGKSFACHQLSKEANGEWWLFLDADARLSDGTLSNAMDMALQQQKGLITGFPRQVTGSWMEKLIVPLMNFTIACHLPVKLVRDSTDPKFVAAHGAFLLIHSDSYRQIGGHAAFKEHLVDDMQMAKAVKRAGLPVTLADITDYVSVRMYNDASEVWNGYKKNVFAGMGRNLPLLIVLLLFYSLLYIVPPIMLIMGSLACGLEGLQSAISLGIVPAFVAWMLGVAIKYRVDRQGKQPAKFAWYLPAAIVLLICIAIASWRAAANGQGYVWKGRRYS
ncbi:glycosyltransferase [Cohnella abietis]|uniref:4,4'-diaponeurosporenoate glycosyltransferase n=1 Tax=Cohnella abietis TaxID=2507935 RepID=A0A3T1D6D3_9BACL|nr:glycosyltransferase family 2 protein [Cohnella abietis]BBI33635.1 glycosyl hydrolase [Cohnella abietis]